MESLVKDTQEMDTCFTREITPFAVECFRPYYAATSGGHSECRSVPADRAETTGTSPCEKRHVLGDQPQWWRTFEKCRRKWVSTSIRSIHAYSC